MKKIAPNKSLDNIVSQFWLAFSNDATTACDIISRLYDDGYASTDIISTLFKVTKGHDDLPEMLKLDFLREIGFTHMRISEGLNSKLQLLGCAGRLSKVAIDYDLASKGKL